MANKPIIWRGSVTDLATDIAAELTGEQLQGLVTALGKWARLNESAPPEAILAGVRREIRHWTDEPYSREFPTPREVLTRIEKLVRQ